MGSSSSSSGLGEEDGGEGSLHCQYKNLRRVEGLRVEDT